MHIELQIYKVLLFKKNLYLSYTSFLSIYILQNIPIFLSENMKGETVLLIR